MDYDSIVLTTELFRQLIMPFIDYKSTTILYRAIFFCKSNRIGFLFFLKTQKITLRPTKGQHVLLWDQGKSFYKNSFFLIYYLLLCNNTFFYTCYIVMFFILKKKQNNYKKDTRGRYLFTLYFIC